MLRIYTDTIKRLAMRVSADFPSAIFSYCILVVQDACSAPYTPKAIEISRPVVNYLKDSPKREASFYAFDSLKETRGLTGLRPLCDT